jgi:hypothetical protein
MKRPMMPNAASYLAHQMHQIIGFNAVDGGIL